MGESFESHEFRKPEPRQSRVRVVSRRAFLVGLGMVAGGAGAAFLDNMRAERAEIAEPITEEDVLGWQLPAPNAQKSATAETNRINAEIAQANAQTRLTTAQTRNLLTEARTKERWWRDPPTLIAGTGSAVAVGSLLHTARIHVDNKNAAELARIAAERQRMTEEAQQRLTQERARLMVEDTEFRKVITSFYESERGGGAEALLLYTMPGNERYFAQVFVTAISLLGRTENNTNNPRDPTRSLRFRQNLARAATAVVPFLLLQGTSLQVLLADGEARPTLEASSTDLSDLSLANRTLSGTRWTNSLFERTIMNYARIQNSVLHDVSAIGAKMRNIMISNCDCAGMDLSCADLTNATITASNLADIRWEGVIVQNARIEAWGLTIEQANALVEGGARDVVLLDPYDSPYTNLTNTQNPLQ